jgi:ABC-type uncharacterized transport system permease subunit
MIHASVSSAMRERCGFWNLTAKGCIRTVSAMVATATDARNER